LSAILCHDGILVVEVKDSLGTKWKPFGCSSYPRKEDESQGHPGNA
jgi:hypothetical protein